MKTQLRCIHLVLALGLSLFSASSVASLAQDSSTKPDNSAQNKDQSATADNQTDAKADRLMAASIRKAIVADKDLSTYAHNVKIIVRNGNVTLKGPVKSEDEKRKVKSDAAGVASQGKIDDQLTVKQ